MNNKGKSEIYSIVNLINNKQYIGSTNNFYRRLLEHINGRQSNRHLQDALKKYGKENFIASRKFLIYAYAPDIKPDIIKLENNIFLFFF